jgi:hypothetical protein
VDIFFKYLGSCKYSMKKQIKSKIRKPNLEPKDKKSIKDSWGDIKTYLVGVGNNRFLINRMSKSEMRKWLSAED